MLNCEVIVAIDNTNLAVRTDRLMKMLTVFENVRYLSAHVLYIKLPAQLNTSSPYLI